MKAIDGTGDGGKAAPKRIPLSSERMTHERYQPCEVITHSCQCPSVSAGAG